MDLASIPRETLVWIAALAIALATLQALASLLRRGLRRRRSTLRYERAMEGEKRAAMVLETRGYRVLGAQVAAEYQLRVDRTDLIVALRADYLVEKRGRRYVAEVKTGAHAPRIENRSTRRQLLEYRIAFDVDGVLLVDGDSGTIQAIEFPALAGGSARSSAWPALAAAVAVSLAALGLARSL